jgi:hypothetical protein
MVGTDQPVHHSGLVLVDSSYYRERQSQIFVKARTHVAEAYGLRLNAVHEDDAHTRKRVVVEFADRVLY